MARAGALWAAAVLLAVAAPMVAAALLPPAAQAEPAWVRGDIRLNVRSGPGTKYRILEGVATGDGLTVLSRTEEWTQVRLENGTQGWIPAGYLAIEPPPTFKLQRLEDEATSLRARLEKMTSEDATLRESNVSLSESDGNQKQEIERLTLENIKLRAGARYPEMIAGASIFCAGMILGAILRRSSGRRHTPRIRL
ncbi:MAG: TIGR04211 family SH3 domain-containing protein [Deltaproteobacteria bacterium]|nr:TIGR04211 family SH3 domain-containing protein [Deltaproteobacteria bacterium]MBW2418833.1 TIGR04211 family SH3 domain-containing protein [Deltaproteobacteria bacterium]